MVNDGIDSGGGELKVVEKKIDAKKESEEVKDFEGHCRGEEETWF